MSEFQVNKTHFEQTRLVDTTETDATNNNGEITAKVNSFSFTANNITYAVMGDKLRYWSFFPPHGDEAQDWGIIPVWGFATVINSESTEIQVGERLFGYFPPATTLTLTPTQVSDGSFIDGSEHRTSLAVGYNVYRRINGEANYNAAFDNERMLLYPLHVTSFCLYDLLQHNDWYNAEQVIIISASSKTSIGLAYALNEDPNSPSVVGITSQRNTEFVHSLGMYNDVVDYQNVTSIDAGRPTVIVDMANNSDVLGKLHKHLGGNMKFCSSVGLTHWDEFDPNPDVITERTQMFFAPGHIQQRITDWGREKFEQKSSAFIQRSAMDSRNWLTIRKINGLTGLAEVYPQVCAGTLPANEGLIVEL